MDQKEEALASVIEALLPDSAHARTFAHTFAHTYAHARTYAHAHARTFAHTRTYAHVFARARASAGAGIYAPFTEDQKAQIDAAYALIFG